MLFSPPPLHGSPLLTPQSLRFHPAQHLAESLILFKNLDIINTVSSGEIEQHQREHCLLVCPPLIRFPHMDMSPDTIANTQDGGKVQIDRKTRHGETLSHSTTHDLSIDEVESSPQGFVLGQRLFKPVICDP